MRTTMSTTNPRTTMVRGSTCLASLGTPRSKSQSWPVCWRISRRAERGRAKFSTKEAGKGGRPENFKQVRLKLQSDPLNRGWRDQPAHGTNKGRGRPQLAQVDDLLARTRCFKCGELGHLAKGCLQNKEPTTNSETFFSGMVCNDSCAGVSRNDSCAGESRNESRADDDSRNEHCVKDEFQRETKPSSMSEKMM